MSAIGPPTWAASGGGPASGSAPVTRAAAEAVSVAALRRHGVLTAADEHVAETVTRLTGEHTELAAVAVALAVRAPRLGHVCLDLDRTLQVGLADAGETHVELELPTLPEWLAALAAAPSVRHPDGQDVTPLVLDGTRLYLDRYWGYEQRLVARLQALLASTPSVLDPARVAQQLDQLFDGDPGDPQRRAAEIATRSGLTVLTGGPGTGKTTTVVRLLATLWTAAATPPRIVLAAPTGKAAARLAEAIRDVARTLPLGPGEISSLQQLPATTLHRLLGWQPRTPTRFRHDARHPLPHDVVIVDEASMASLPLMTKLTEALADGTRLVLVGDRDQLASVDAGAVLSDVCGPRGGSATEVSGQPLARSIVTLTRFHRFGTDSGIGAVARAIGRLGSGAASTGTRDRPGTGEDQVLGLLRGERAEPGGPGSYDDVTLLPPPAAHAGSVLPVSVLDEIVADYAVAVRGALDGAPVAEVLDAFDRVRVLAALRRGPDGVETLTPLIERHLAAAVPGYDLSRPFPVGQPVLVTRNDHASRLYNGDVGVVVRDPEDATRRRVAFLAAGGEVRLIAPGRLPDSEAVFAMSIHKSQGSQFDRVVLVLPRRDSPLLNRELVYTGVTRAARHVTVIADEPILRAALGRQVQRASGLAERLWGSADGEQP